MIGFPPYEGQFRCGRSVRAHSSGIRGVEEQNVLALVDGFIYYIMFAAVKDGKVPRGIVSEEMNSRSSPFRSSSGPLQLPDSLCHSAHCNRKLYVFTLQGIQKPKPPTYLGRMQDAHGDF